MITLTDSQGKAGAHTHSEAGSGNDHLNTLIADLLDARLFLSGASPKIRREARARFEAARDALKWFVIAKDDRIAALEAAIAKATGGAA